MLGKKRLLQMYDKILTLHACHSQRDVSNLYTLFAVINHQGKMDTGHYTMYTKSRDEASIVLND